MNDGASTPDSILCHPWISESLFNPRSGCNPSPFIVESSGATLSCFFENRLPEGYTIVFFHGNGEVVENYAFDLPRIFETIGCNAFICEYRGYGESNGSPNLLNFLSDAESIVRSLPCASEKVILFGRSLGCLQAVHAAHHMPQCRGLILESGIADLSEYLESRISRVKRFRSGLFGTQLTSTLETHSGLDGIRADAQKYFDHREKLRAYRGRSLVFHAVNDIHIPIHSSVSLLEWLPEPKKLCLMERGDHNSIFVRNIGEYCELIYRRLVL